MAKYPIGYTAEQAVQIAKLTIEEIQTMGNGFAKNNPELLDEHETEDLPYKIIATLHTLLNKLLAEYDNDNGVFRLQEIFNENPLLGNWFSFYTVAFCDIWKTNISLVVIPESNEEPDEYECYDDDT